MNDYYIVALDTKPRIVYLDENKLDEKDNLKLTNLAYIDYITSQYDEETFRNYLFKNNIISYKDTPIFIVHTHMYKGKIRIIFNNLIFKGKYSNLLLNLSLTTLRERALSLKDCAYLIDIFEKNYYYNNDFKEIANYLINEKSIEKIIKYRERKNSSNASNYDEKYKNENPLKYRLMRDLVSSLNEYSKYQDIDSFLLSVYKRDDYSDLIIPLIPEKSLVDKIERQNVSYDDLEDIKNAPWDNKDAEEMIKNERYTEEFIRTATLEDQLRAGLISDYDYIYTRRDSEQKFKR
ncbi:MAG: hypothetical protein IJ572_05705 [Bacilli bacterium]|nr:hypothetical protein [Bacilli bacterium]